MPQRIYLHKGGIIDIDFMQSSTHLLIALSLVFVLISIFFLPSSQIMPSLPAIRASNAAFSPAYTPVALFVGGTSGIGQGMAEAFARHLNGNAHIVIVGRNRAAADSIISQFPKPTAAGITHEFIQCDITQMKNVQSVTNELLTRLPKINFLVMTPGIMTTKGRDETVEGIDKKMAVHYYARWKFTHDLMPALLKANAAGEDAKVMSVMAAGKGGEIDLDDLGLKKSYSLTNAALAAATYNDLAMEVSFSHTLSTFVLT
jgi:NAD(P)-dependent dehydrogenase (short-subunit alcohol dehydrogenase family)